MTFYIFALNYEQICYTYSIKIDIEWLDTTKSTQIDIRKLFLDARNDNKPLKSHAIGAFYQSGGTGRLNRQWVAPPETSLLISVLVPLNVTFPNEYANALGIVASMAAKQASLALLHEFRDTDTELKIKWPNDILAIRGESIYKVSGIKSEFLGEYQGQNWYSIGVGINVWQSNFELDIDAKIRPSSLVQLCAQMANVVDSERKKYIIRLGNEFIETFFNLIDNYLTKHNLPGLQADFTSHLFINQPITVHLTDGATVSGKSVGVDNKFNLRLLPNGENSEEMLITVGDVTPAACQDIDQHQ